MTERQFVRYLALCDERSFAELAGRLYRHVHDLAMQGLSEDDPEDLLFTMLDIRPDTGPADKARLQDLVRDVLGETIEAATALPANTPPDVELGLRRLKRALSIPLSSDKVPYSILVAGPPADEETFEKPGAAQRASDLMRRHRLSCRAFGTETSLGSARGLLLEAPLGTSEVLLAGQAMALDVPLAVIGPEGTLPGFPAFETPDAALRHVLRQEGTDPDVRESDGADPRPPELPDGNDVPTLRLRCTILEEAYRSLRRSAIFLGDRHAERMAEIDKLMREDRVPQDVSDDFFCIVGNGRRWDGEPTSAARITAMRHRIQALESEVESLRKDASPDSIEQETKPHT